MIEVEKKFQPTDEELQKLLAGAEFLGEVVNHDIYYDYEDLGLFNKDVKLRNRNGNFELKITKTKDKNDLSVSSNEIEDQEEIEKYLGIDSSIQDYVNKNMIVFSDYVNNRKKYKKEKFTIDLDDIDFGYKLCEVELIVENENQIKDTEDSIVEFLRNYGIELKKIVSKREAYLRLKNPVLYKKIYG